MGYNFQLINDKYFFETSIKLEIKKEKKSPDVGVEPTTVGLKVQRSTTELTGLVEKSFKNFHLCIANLLYDFQGDFIDPFMKTL